MMDDLAIPAFLRRDPADIKPVALPNRLRMKKIPYPKDGYACKGKRQAFRERHRMALRRRAEKMRLLRK